MRQSIAAVEGEAAAAALARYTAPEEVMVFPGHCPACGGEADQRMFPTTIPYFKEVIVMACACDSCGYRSSELKAGGRIPSKGRRIALRVKSAADLSRDVIKSDTASVAIPEVDLELTAGTLGGRVTTVEGLLQDIARSLREVQGFSVGDSGPEWKRQKWKDLDERLTKVMRGAEGGRRRGWCSEWRRGWMGCSWGQQRRRGLSSWTMPWPTRSSHRQRNASRSKRTCS